MAVLSVSEVSFQSRLEDGWGYEVMLWCHVIALFAYRFDVILEGLGYCLRVLGVLFCYESQVADLESIVHLEVLERFGKVYRHFIRRCS